MATPLCTSEQEPVTCHALSRSSRASLADDRRTDVDRGVPTTAAHQPNQINIAPLLPATLYLPLCFRLSSFLLSFFIPLSPLLPFCSLLLPSNLLSSRFIPFSFFLYLSFNCLFPSFLFLTMNLYFNSFTEFLYFKIFKRFLNDSIRFSYFVKFCNLHICSQVCFVFSCSAANETI